MLPVKASREKLSEKAVKLLSLKEDADAPQNVMRMGVLAMKDATFVTSSERGGKVKEEK